MREVRIECDAVVLMTRRRSDDALFLELLRRCGCRLRQPLRELRRSGRERVDMLEQVGRAIGGDEDRHRRDRRPGRSRHRHRQPMHALLQLVV